ELTSTLTLSVSNSTTGSPFSTLSPLLTSHSAMVPSVIDSASSGILISFTIVSSLSWIDCLCYYFLLVYFMNIRFADCSCCSFWSTYISNITFVLCNFSQILDNG